MENDYFTEKRQQIAKNLIATWKSDPTLAENYATRGDFFTAEMCNRLWRDKHIRAEFTDRGVLEAFLKNEHRVFEHKAGITSHKKPEKIDDDTHSDDGIKSRWDADSKLRDEFDNDFAAYSAWHANRHKVRVYNR
jgi:hypothetical protein